MPNHRRHLILILLAVVLVHAALVVALPTQLALTMTAEESGKLVFVSAVAPGDPFGIRFIHSVHRTPVEEQFRVTQDRKMVLERVSYETYGVGNPSEPEPGEEFRMEDGTLIIENMNRRLSEIHLRIGQKVANHELVLGGSRVPFTTWSAPGSRVLLKVKRVSLWMLWTL
jgi:hypothetical protein